jgi:enoyl-CoA hydratase/carnithine racemase
MRPSFFLRQKKSLLDAHSSFLSVLRSHDAKMSSKGNVTLQIRQAGEQRVAVLKILNESKRGSIDANMMLQLAEAVDSLESETEPPVGLVLASHSNFFCSGLDLHLAKNCINTPAMGADMCAFMTDALNRLRNSPCISVTVISGPAIGGGSELVLCTDFRIMRSHPENFVQSVHARIGAAPGWGGAARLVATVGRGHALRMLGGSLKITPNEALRIGLVDELYDDSANSTVGASEGGEYDASVEAGLRYLQPFTSQKYAGSVRGIKRIVAAATAATGGLRAAEEEEAKVFASRWFGPDNRHALGLPPSNPNP